MALFWGFLSHIEISFGDNMQEVFQHLPRERIYSLTGTQFLPFNSLFQLYSLARKESPLLAAAHDILFMPDLFNYLLTGEKNTEFTFATTSQLYNPVEADWEEEILEFDRAPKNLLRPIILPGTLVGAFEAGDQERNRNWAICPLWRLLPMTPLRQCRRPCGG